MDSYTDKILCEILLEMKKSNSILQGKENRDSKILTITIPETPTVTTGTRSFANGTTEIDFKLGAITDPDGTITKFQGLTYYKRESEVFRSITVVTDKDIVLQVQGSPEWKFFCNLNYSNQFTYLEYTKIKIVTNQTTEIQIFACTNPEAVVSVFTKNLLSVV